MTWTVDAVWHREVEAMRTLTRLPPARVEGLRAHWPAIRRDFADAVNAEETRDPKAWPSGWLRPAPPTARAIDEMTEVWSWHAAHLADRADLVRLLQAMALAVARGRPELSAVPHFKKRRWLAYRLKEQALTRIAAGLNAV